MTQNALQLPGSACSMTYQKLGRDSQFENYWNRVGAPKWVDIWVQLMLLVSEEQNSYMVPLIPWLLLQNSTGRRERAVLLPSLWVGVGITRASEVLT